MERARPYVPWLSRLRALPRDERGSYVTEFAITAPAFILLLVGAIDVTQRVYMQSIVQGEVQKAARDSSLQTGSETAKQTAIDDQVKSQILNLYKTATVTFSRRYYKTFSKASAAKAEEFTDSASGIYKDGICNNGEPYSDDNNNNTWDADGADSGQGGAKDNVIYKVTVTYPHIVPIDSFIGGSGTTSVSASTILSNQPYGQQASYSAPTVRNCT
jgi:Flp pilus assembly protein TadG